VRYNRPRSRSRVMPIAGLVVVALLAGGYARIKTMRAAKEEKPVPPRVVKPAAPKIDYARIQANELGYIPVIMYHEIGGKPIPSDPGLVRAVDSFKKDLEMLYAANFRPVNISDVLNNDIDVPAGTSPVVLTFDDARESQFRLIDTGSTLKVDPNSGMGIMAAFHQEHPDWPMRATFFVLPKSNLTMEPFGQLGMGAQKLNYIVEQGMEIGNHSIHHRNMSRMTPAQIQAEIGGAHNSILAAAPKARIQVVALPMGRYPRDKRNWTYLVKGSYEGKSYQYKGAMRAAYRAVPSPASKDFDPMAMERITPADVRWGVRWWIDTLTKGGEYPRYVSDGDPKVVAVPQGMEKQVNLARLQAQGKKLVTYSGGGGAGGAKPIVIGDSGETAAPANGASSIAVSPATPASAPKPISSG
jgi:peptidoglycan/xylan/chitin deacetylase (PgdA/CDA1 family)